MSDKEKRKYRDRNPLDPANYHVNVRLRESQKAKLDATPGAYPISSFMSNLVDDFFRRHELDKYLIFAAKLEKISAVDAICMIGNQIEARAVGACLEAWLDGSAVPPLKATETAIARYKQLTEGLHTTPGEAVLIEDSVRMLDFVREIYFNEKSMHLTTCEMGRHLVSSGAATGAARKAIVDRINDLINAEYSVLYELAMLSPQIRFATFLCLHRSLLKVPAEKPDWAVVAKRRLIAMNEPWIDAETNDVPDVGNPSDI